MGQSTCCVETYMLPCWTLALLFLKNKFRKYEHVYIIITHFCFGLETLRQTSQYNFNLQNHCKNTSKVDLNFLFVCFDSFHLRFTASIIFSFFFLAPSTYRPIMEIQFGYEARVDLKKKKEDGKNMSVSWKAMPKWQKATSIWYKTRSKQQQQQKQQMTQITQIRSKKQIKRAH